MNENNDLVGETITAIHLAQDRKAIRFDVEDGDPVIARTDGDCCSNSWVESLDTPELLIGGRVRAVESIDVPELEDQPDYGLIQHYGCKVTTDKGSCVIDYRNESNGYYGGWMVWPDDRHFYGGVYGQNVSDENWRQIAP